jgi:acyl carrier protein
MKKYSCFDVVKLIAKCINIYPENINLNSKSDDFDSWDSVNHIRIILEIEKIKKKKINTNLALKLNSVKKIIKYLNK